MSHVFRLQIDTRSRASFGENETQERLRVAQLLHDVANKLGSGVPLEASNPIRDPGGGAEEAANVGTFGFGALAVCKPK